MEKASSCIAVFTKYSDAGEAVEMLVGAGMEPGRISLLGKYTQEGKVAAKGTSALDDDLRQLGVQEENLHCYKCLISGGAYLVVVSGDYQEVDWACGFLEQQGRAEVSVHFNAP
ncbi:hypothetical protein [Thiolapillus sp.]